MSDTPTPEPGPQRNARGQFVRGCRGGPGRPRGRSPSSARPNPVYHLLHGVQIEQLAAALALRDYAFETIEAQWGPEITQRVRQIVAHYEADLLPPCHTHEPDCHTPRPSEPGDAPQPPDP